MNNSKDLLRIYPQDIDIPINFRCDEPQTQQEFLVNGRMMITTGKMHEVFSPILIRTKDGLRQEKIGAYPMLTKNEALDILDYAVKAYDEGKGTWATYSVEHRISHLKEFISRMKMVRNETVNLIMWEIGKSYDDSTKEFDRTVKYIEDTIEALKELDRVSSRFTVEQGVIAQIRRAPLGVVLCLGPYNYPLNETFTTLIPALIMGNTVVFKPPRMGVLLHRPLLEAFKESFPPGVVNTVYGSATETMGPMMETGKINVLAFIGSSRVASVLKHQHPKPHRLRCILGLEAKNAAIILPDADIDHAVSECVLGTLSFNGQRCTALKMLYVHKSIQDKFLSKFSEAVDNLKIGMPWENDVFITPLAEKTKVNYMTELVEDALKKGAKVVNKNGFRSCETLFSPTVLFPVDQNMKVYSEEQFGPVIPISPFEDIETPIRYITESNYGQQVSLFGQDPKLIGELIDPLVNQVCRVNINCQCQRGPDIFPFTGRKDSAEGTLSVSDALRVFSIRTLVAAKDIDINKKLINQIVRNHQSRFLSTDYIL